MSAEERGRPARGPSRGAADRLDELMTQLFGHAPALTLATWDGSRVDHGDDGVVVHVLSRRAVRRLLWAPGPLGVARAYVAQDIDVEGDFVAATRILYDYAEEVGHDRVLDPAGRREVLRTTVLLGAVGPAPRPPDEPMDAVGGYAHVGAWMQEALPDDLAHAVLGGALPEEERAGGADDPGRTVLHVTGAEPLSEVVARWEKADVEVASVTAVRDEHAAVLLDRLERLGERWPDVVAAAGETRARLWRLSLAASRENLRRGRVSAYRIVAANARP